MPPTEPVPGTVREVVGRLGEEFARFDSRTQDSGHVSYGVLDQLHSPAERRDDPDEAFTGSPRSPPPRSPPPSTRSSTSTCGSTRPAGSRETSTTGA